MAIGEMLVLTIPLSLLSLALTSRLSNTGTRRLDSLTQSAEEAQFAARGAAACRPGMNLAEIVMLGDLVADSRVRKSLVLQAPAAAMILPTGSRTASVTANSSDYRFTFSKLARDFAPDAQDDRPVSSSATFLCNEPIGTGEDKQWLLGAWVFGNGMWQARKLFTGNSAGGPKSERVEPPAKNPAVESSRGSFEGSYQEGKKKQEENENSNSKE